MDDVRPSLDDTGSEGANLPHGHLLTLGLAVIVVVGVAGVVLDPSSAALLLISVAALRLLRPETFERATRTLRGWTTQNLSGVLRLPASLVVLGALGAALRLRAFLVDRALWLDEAALARSLLERDFLRLFAFPLMEDQSAPPGFLALVHGSVTLFGFNETSLRLVPLLASIATLVCAVLLARRAFASSMGSALFVALIAFSPFLIYYGQEFKQYSLDALAATGVLLVRDRRWMSSHPWWTGLALAGLAVLSLPGAVLVTILVGMEIAESWATEERRAALRSPMVALSGVIVHLAYTQLAGTDRGRMVRIWSNAGAFPPDQGLVAQARWTFDKLLEISWVGLAHSDIGGSRVGVGEPALLMPFLLLVGFALWRAGHTARFAAMTLLASVFLAHVTLYPIASRLSLHLVPILAFLAAVGLERFREAYAQRRWVTVVSRAALGLVLLLPISASAERLLDPRDTMDIRAAVALLNEQHRPGDVVVMNQYSQLAWDVYTGAELVHPRFHVDWDVHPGGTPESVRAILSEYAPIGDQREALPRRFWFAAPHRASQLQEAMQAVGDEFGLTTVCDVLEDGLFVGVLSEAREASDPELCAAK